MFSKRFRFVIGCILAMSLGFFGYRWFAITPQLQESIQKYSPARDQAALLKIFDDNVFWLTNDPDFFSAHNTFAYQLERGMNFDGLYGKHNLTTVVYHEDGKTKGFVSYYLLSPTRGKILYIAVDKDERRKGYAEKLLRYAVEQLEVSGAITIELDTRIVNRDAHALYTKLGFVITWADGDEDAVRFERVSDKK